MLSSERSKNVVVAAALLAALGLLAVRRLPRLLFEPALYSDGTTVLDEVGALRHAVWEAPRRLPGTVNSPAREGRPALSPDGRWLVYALGEPGLSCDLWIAEVVAGEPLEARPLTSLNTSADELSPAFGESALLFASDRPGGQGGYDLWRAPFAAGRVGPADPLEGGLNSPADELDPAWTRDASGQRLLAFASNRARGGRGDLELYLARLDRPLAPATTDVELERLEALSSAGDDREPAFGLEGRALWLASDRDEPGRFALYRTLREADGWLPPRRVEGLGAGAPRGPAPSSDGFTLWFEADAPASGISDAPDRDLYRARSIEVLRRPPPDLGWTDLLLVGLLLATALLAWLARRWHELDVLYKCFLASVIVHLLLMALLGEVRPEAEARPLREGEGPTFRVHVLEDSSLATRTRERGGELERVRAQARVASAPARVSVGVGPRHPDSAPAAEVAPAAPAPLAAPAAETARVEREAPGPGQGEAAVALRAPVERFERLDGAAAPLQVVAADLPLERQARVPAAPETVELTALAAEGARRVSAPAEVALSGPRAEVAAAPGFRPSRVERGQELARGTLQADLATPSERFEPRASAPLRQLALPPSARFVAPESSGASAVPSSWQAGEERVADAQRPGGAPPATLELAPSVHEGAGPPGTPARGVDRARGPPEALDRVALAQPLERFEPPARAAVVPAEPALPAPSVFAPSRASVREAATPRRWSAPGTAAAPAVVRPETLAARPREDVRALPEPPRRLDDTPYRTRFGAEKAVALAEHGGGAETERAVALGLAYLASIQNEDGSWGNPRLRHEKYRQVAIGKTGLALLAFLGAGHTPLGGAHAATTRRAVDYLLGSQEARTGHFGDSSAYSHGIATYALAECHALTRDEALRAPLERAVRQVLRHQVTRGGARLVGGWSYYYPDGAVFDRWPRVSISAWQVMALESARLGGLEVPDEAFDAARTFLLRSWDPRLEAFRYSHDPARLRSGYPTLPGSTPAALFALSLLGVDVGDEALAPARRFTLERAPSGFRWSGDDAFVARAAGNVYFWYYGSLALFRLGGPEWERWNTALKETLLPSQAEDGSWRPLDVYARYAGDDDDDRSYTTALCVLSLEVYYRYFTPLLEVR